MKKNLITLIVAAMVANVTYAQDNQAKTSPEFFDFQTSFAQMDAHFAKIEQEMAQVQQNFDKSFQALKQQIKAQQNFPANKDSYYQQQSFSSSNFHSQSAQHSPLSITESMAFNQYSSQVQQTEKNGHKKIEKIFAGNLLSTNYPWLNQMLLTMEYQALGGKEAKPTIQQLNQLWQQKYQQVNQAKNTAIVKVQQQLMFADKNIASFYQQSDIQLALENQKEKQQKQHIGMLNVNLKTQQPIVLKTLIQPEKWPAFNAALQQKVQQKLASLDVNKLTNKEKSAFTADIKKANITLGDNYYLSKAGLNIIYPAFKLGLKEKDLNHKQLEILFSWQQMNNWIKKEYVYSSQN